MLDDIGAGHTAVVVTAALWSDYLQQRVPGGEPAWAARFGLVLVDEASQATESQAATALRWARDGARMGLWGHTKPLGPHRRDGARPPTSWDDASDSLMAQRALRLDGSTEVRVVLASSYRAPSSVMHIYSSCTYQGELRSAPSNHKKYAPPGMAWPALRLKSAVGGSEQGLGLRLLEAMRAATPLQTWKCDLPWLFFGDADGQPDGWAAGRHPRSVLLAAIQRLTGDQRQDVRSAARWCLNFLDAEDEDPAASAWHLCDAMRHASPADLTDQLPPAPQQARPQCFAPQPPPSEDPEALEGFTLPQATGPMLSTADATLVPCNMVATSPNVHVPGCDVGVLDSFANVAEADLLLQLLLTHGGRRLHDSLSIRVLAAYSGQVSFMQHALRLLFDRASGDRRRLAHRLLDIPIQTVDAAQGAESDIVLASLVRANTRRDLGFLGDARRTNVLLSRARVAQITVGHAPTLVGSNWNDSPGLLVPSLRPDGRPPRKRPGWQVDRHHSSCHTARPVRPARADHHAAPWGRPQVGLGGKGPRRRGPR